MHKLIRKSVMAGILSMLLSAASSAAFAMPEIMPLSEVMPGMSGTAYTVMDASGEMRSFQVDVVGINGTGRDDSKMIMARAYGPLIDETDGVLQGMSGSPVYRRSARGRTVHSHQGYKQKKLFHHAHRENAAALGHAGHEGQDSISYHRPEEDCRGEGRAGSDGRGSGGS